MAGRIDEGGSAAAELPPLDRAYQIDYRLLSDRLAEIPDEVNAILKLFDGRRTLAQVLAEAERDGVAAAKVLAKLWSEEIIRPVPSSPAPAGGPVAATAEQKLPVPDPGPGGAAEAGHAEWFTGPDAELPPQGDARDAAQPAPPVASDVAGAVPRIVRFPARPRGAPRAARGEVTAAHSLPAALRVRRPTRPEGGARRPAPASGRRRRSATALLVAAALAAMVLWRMVASRSPGPEEGGASSSAPADRPAPPREPALGR